MGIQDDMKDIFNDMVTEDYKLTRFDVDLFKRTYLKDIENNTLDENFIRIWSTIAGGLQRTVLLVDKEDNVVGHVNPLLKTHDNLNPAAVTNLLSTIDKKISRSGLNPKTAYDVLDNAVDANVVKQPFVVMYMQEDTVEDESVVNKIVKEDTLDISRIFEI